MLNGITEVSPDVYDLTVAQRNGARYRVFLVDGDEPTLVDAGFGDTVDSVVDRVESADVDPTRLVVTHGDPDHVGGLAGLADRLDLETWLPEGLAVEGHEPDRRYGDGDEVGPFTAVHTPGHTPEHHALVAEERDFAVLGDAVFGADARGLPENFFVLPPGVFSADLNRADESLARLTEFEFDDGLVFHGSSVVGEASEKLRRFVEFDGRP